MTQLQRATVAQSFTLFKREVLVKVVLARHHVDHLEEGGEGVVEDVVLPHRQVERERERQQDRREH